MRPRNFKEFYEAIPTASSPRKKFIEEIAAVTHKSPVTVRMWLSGRQKPDELTKAVIASHLGVKAEGLFPNAHAENYKPLKISGLCFLSVKNPAKLSPLLFFGWSTSKKKNELLAHHVYTRNS